MKILIVAQNASSRFGGESFLPLKYFELLSRRPGVEVDLVVHGRNRDDLSQLFPDLHQRIHYIEDTALHIGLWRLDRWIPKTIGDAVFGTLLNLFDEFRQRRVIRSIIRRQGADVIHQPIPVSPKAPSALFGLGKPVVIGPMNGGMSYPQGYEDYQSRSSRSFVNLARKLAVAMNWVIPGKRQAAVLLVANERTRQSLPFNDHPRVVQLVENAVDMKVWLSGVRPRGPGDGTFRLVYLGRLVRWKAIDFTLEAIRIARAQGHDVRLELIGDGEEAVALKQRADDLGLGAAVTFSGYRPQSFCAQQLEASDALILNSIYECGGAVVLEAMSLGLPIIAAEWGGPADYVDPTCGILVSPVPRETYAQRLAEAIVCLAQDPDLRARLGSAGQRRIRQDFDWEKKVDRMLEIYQDALRAPVPSARPQSKPGPTT